jgi:thiamine biosynthesis lipoprotein
MNPTLIPTAQEQARGGEPVRVPNPSPVAAVRERIRSGARLSMVNGVNELEFGAMGTRCRVAFGEGATAAAVAGAVVDWVGTFEARYSRFLPGSLVSQVNAAAGGPWVALDAEAMSLFGLCGQLVYLTRGVLDPTMSPLVTLWDWKRGRVPTDAEVEAARLLVGWRQVQLVPGRIRLPKVGMALDLGGVGKEYAVDQVILMLAGMGVRSALVDFGADIRLLGLPVDGRAGWKIGLEDPLEPGKARLQVVVREGAVATSGGYLRGFEVGGRRFGHILDSRTGRPVDNGVLSSTVHAPSCTQAGMLSTALCVLGLDEGRRLLDSTPGVEGCMMTRDGLVSSKRFYEHITT